MPLNISKNILQQEIDKRVSELSKLRNSTVFLYFGGIERSAVDIVANMISKNVQEKKSLDKVDVILHSTGGDPDAAYHLGKMLQDKTKTLTFIIPRFAKSAATLLACSADEIIMLEKAELGPLDPQITLKKGSEVMEFSALSVKATLELIQERYRKGQKELANQLVTKLPQPIVMGELNRTLEIGEKYLAELSKRMYKNNKQKISNLKKKLVYNYTHHSYVINQDEASKELKLNARLANNDEKKIIEELFLLQMQLQQLGTIQQKLNEYERLKNDGII